MKKAIVFLLAFMFVFSASAYAVDARSATETARALAPWDFSYLYTEKDGKTYEVHFVNEATGEEIEISVPVDESKAVKIETESKLAAGSSQNTVSEEVIRTKVLEEYPNAQIDSVFTMMDDGLYEVHVYFALEDQFGRVKLNAETGAIFERKIIMSAPVSGWQKELDDDYQENLAESGNNGSGNKAASDNASSNNTSFISVSQAKSAVTSRYPDAKITEIELDFEGGKYVYEGEAYLNRREYDFKVDATTGNLIKWKLDD